jgi:mannose-6-phosphate isomerase
LSSADYIKDLFAPPGDDSTWTDDGTTRGHIEHSKAVLKGWGEERWLVSESAPWGFKVIHINAGKRTSLQYHREKEEACLLLSGEALLHRSGGPAEDLRVSRVHSGDVIHIKPGNVHRFEAVTDMTMVEVSTAHLDDVIRLADDWSRGDGRIEAEHNGES